MAANHLHRIFVPALSHRRSKSPHPRIGRRWAVAKKKGEAASGDEKEAAKGVEEKGGVAGVRKETAQEEQEDGGGDEHVNKATREIGSQHGPESLLRLLTSSR
uniref:Uncharacterized protein n=1 Tax=Oryza australiensis TaxID=4532 RepID=A0A1V1H977_9ORYZ|nr:hypothetical protein [Oryza australiensis]